VEATEQAIDSDQECAAVMHQQVAVRGAINGLLAEVLEHHVREHLIGATRCKAQVQAADELIDIAHAYFRSCAARSAAAPYRTTIMPCM
jgi:DNA-binding FrmR family transcriptional regulator